MEPGHDEHGRRIWMSPAIEAGEYEFTYLNTRIRVFGNDWAYMNHVEYTQEDGSCEGMMVSQEFMNTLWEANFPYSFDPYPSQKDTEWFVRLEMHELADK